MFLRRKDNAKFLNLQILYVKLTQRLFFIEIRGKGVKKTRQSSSVLGELARSVGGIITYF